jgi:uncharacterized phage protein (TIGR01671 family)
MSREIKFRVWDKDGKLTGFNRFEKGRWQCQMLQAAGGSGEWSSGVLHGQAIDQYTGLKDKNDVEIYEGDVVRFKAWKGNHQGSVEWNQGTCGFEIELSPTSSTGFFRDLLRVYEVIGNIYENPELIAPEAKQ